ncbi:DUF3291 domain-containing protein [Streptomyces sp. ms191]|uniref:MFS transporter n=1 Tax=Streptomyces sp. ms191 TaxID=1827978 RepID=UPI0011CD7C5B|nr:MFS transporter [Streptomyces sp. ms191]TXS21718.1 DUF3291 domain-containing protein [Streptomyces sp. ms191]
MTASAPAAHLAQLNLATLLHPLDDPRMAPFVEMLDPVNAAADAAPGFVWRLVEEGSPDATGLRPAGEGVIVNMSVWESQEALWDFTYRSGHLEVMRGRRDWFARHVEAHLVLWWVPAGHRPTVGEALERLADLRAHGPSPRAFTFSSRGPAARAATAPDAGTAEPTRRRTPRRIWILAALALMLMLCEGVANDWSVLHLRDVLDAPAATAALAYGAFSTAMTAGRLLADRLTGRFGAVAILRHGSAVAALGLTAAALSPWIPLALAGWAVFGAGLSGCIPQLFSAAGHADSDAAGVNVSRVAGLGYLGMLAGPAVIGPLTHLVPLNLTFLLPVAFCVVAAGAAGILREPEPEPTRPGVRPRTETV